MTDTDTDTDTDTNFDSLLSEADRIEDEIDDCDDCEGDYVCETHTAKLATLGGVVDLGAEDSNSTDSEERDV